MTRTRLLSVCSRERIEPVASVEASFTRSSSISVNVESRMDRAARSIVSSALRTGRRTETAGVEVMECQGAPLPCGSTQTLLVVGCQKVEKRRSAFEFFPTGLQRLFGLLVSVSESFPAHRQNSCRKIDGFERCYSRRIPMSPQKPRGTIEMSGRSSSGVWFLPRSG